MNRKIIPLMFSLFLFIHGCGTIGVKVIEHDKHFKPEISSDIGTIYIYREPSHAGSKINIPILIKGQMVGGLSNLSYMVYESPPGELTIEARSPSGESAERRVTVLGGDKHFLRFQLLDLFWNHLARLEIVQNIEGEQAIQPLTYVTLNPLQ